MRDVQKLRDLLEQVELRSKSARRNAESAVRMTGLIIGEAMAENRHAKFYDEISATLRALISQAEGEGRHA